MNQQNNITYLSIDVGIRNLGVCCFSIQPPIQQSIHNNNTQHHIEPIDLLRSILSRTNIHYWNVGEIYKPKETKISQRKRKTTTQNKKKKKKTTKVSLDILVPELCNYIITIIKLYKPSTIIIERQPAKSKKTLILMYSLYSHLFKQYNTRLFHAKHKMNICKLFGFTPSSTCTKANKETAISTVSSDIINYFPSFKDMFYKALKKDDLADSLLQGLAFYYVEKLEKKAKPKAKRKKKIQNVSS